MTRQIVFALEFRGQAGPSPGNARRRRARSTAPSQALSTELGRRGITAHVEPRPGAAAVLDSEVERYDDGSFIEWGTIRYGEAGGISFTTVGRGIVGAGPIPGWVRGAVI